MLTMHSRPRDIGRQTSRELAARFGRDLRTARMVAGLRQRDVGTRAGVSQSVVSRVERGVSVPSLDLMGRLTAAVGCRLSCKLFPADGPSLRDGGQLQLIEVVRRQLHASWNVTLEAPIGTGDDRRAADMVIENRLEIALGEFESNLYDAQGQVRPAQLKRAALAERLGRPVRLLFAIADTEANRRAAANHAGLLAAAFPVRGRRAWAALRSGEPLGGDALIWVRRAGPMRRVHAIPREERPTREPIRHVQ